MSETEAAEVTQRHLHRPMFFSDPYDEFGVEWVTPVCECGQPLNPRRISARDPKAPPLPEQFAAAAARPERPKFGQRCEKNHEHVWRFRRCVA